MVENTATSAQAVSEPPPKKRPIVPACHAVKRTFRYPSRLDRDFKKFVHRYNLEKADDEPELTVEEAGVIMLTYFLKSEPKDVVNKARNSNQSTS